MHSRWRVQDKHHRHECADVHQGHHQKHRRTDEVPGAVEANDRKADVGQEKDCEAHEHHVEREHITIHEIGADGDVHFIATEFIEGETLRAALAGAPLKVGELLSIAEQVAAALAAAHEAGIIHRDIKPENIMVRRDGIVKVLDFGLAKLALLQPEAVDTEITTLALVKTNPGMLLGTVQYMSPEQARGLEVDARTDIFSFGVVLYEMVAGRKPFSGETTSDLIASILKSEAAPPTLSTRKFLPNSNA